MIFTPYEQLTVIKLDNACDKLPYHEVAKAVLDRPSNVIYCEVSDCLYGIISMGDVSRAKRQDGMEGYVPINSSYTYVVQGEFVKAKDILQNKKQINAVPVINKNGVLKGCYSRWKAPQEIYVNLKSSCKLFFHKGDKIILVRPNESLKNKLRIFGEYKKCLYESGVLFDVVSYAGLLECYKSANWILFVDEDEHRAIDTIFSEYFIEQDAKGKLISYENVVWEYEYNLAGYYLRRLKNAGIESITLNCINNQYWKMFMAQIENKFRMEEKEVANRLPESMYKNFMADLYTEDYAEKVMNIPYSVENRNGIMRLKDYSSLLYNVINGERKTVGQPLVFKRTIFFVGPCFIYGHYSEDGNTIESYLQKYLNDAGYAVRVINYGCPSYSRQPIVELAHIINTPMKKGDIIVLYMDNRIFDGIIDIDLLDTMAEYNVPVEWVVDHPLHCNHRINELWAKTIFDKIKPMVESYEDDEELLEENHFIKTLYIDRCFAGFRPTEFTDIGAIVMNCNPFTKGHRYLIEKALEIVDFLIIFVVEEDASFFSFNERFSMVCSGVEDLKNVMVVPSGPFILSKLTFHEYFIKVQDEYIVENTENDIRVFASQIAPYLNIKYRFVGEEPGDAVTRQYNMAMKKILPEYGIELIEIPRKKIGRGGEYISATKVRKCLTDREVDQLDDLLPESTKRWLGLAI